MSKDLLILFGIIAVVTVLGLAIPVDSVNEDEIADRIVVGINSTEDIADDVGVLFNKVVEQDEKERLAELGYPDGYDPMNPIANGEFTEEDWDAIQKEDAMRSLAEDAMNEYYREEPDISDHVLKP